MIATYVSVFDDSVICESFCNFDPTTKVCSNIQPASNADDANDADSLTDEFVRLSDGTELRTQNGVKFNY